MRKGFAPILLLVLIVIVLVGAGAYYLGTQNRQITLPISIATPIPVATENPTANWKTYKDVKEGVEFKYPGSWYTTPYTPSTFSVFLDAVPIKIPEASEFITPIHVGYNEATNTVTNEKFYTEKTLAEGVVRYKGLFDPKNVTVQENLMVSGKKAARIYGKIDPEGFFGGEYFDYTLIQMDGKLLVVTLYGGKYQEIYNQIISTFKFTQ